MITTVVLVLSYIEVNTALAFPSLGRSDYFSLVHQNSFHTGGLPSLFGKWPLGRFPPTLPSHSQMIPMGHHTTLSSILLPQYKWLEHPLTDKTYPKGQKDNPLLMKINIQKYINGKIVTPISRKWTWKKNQSTTKSSLKAWDYFWLSTTTKKKRGRPRKTTTPFPTIDWPKTGPMPQYLKKGCTRMPQIEWDSYWITTIKGWAPHPLASATPHMPFLRKWSPKLFSLTKKTTTFKRIFTTTRFDIFSTRKKRGRPRTPNLWPFGRYFFTLPPNMTLPTLTVKPPNAPPDVFYEYIVTAPQSTTTRRLRKPFITRKPLFEYSDENYSGPYTGNPNFPYW
jgi:hypothetical protein